MAFFLAQRVKKIFGSLKRKKLLSCGGVISLRLKEELPLHTLAMQASGGKECNAEPLGTSVRDRHPRIE
jgi:hypothetical protein